MKKSIFIAQSIGLILGGILLGIIGYLGISTLITQPKDTFEKDITARLSALSLMQTANADLLASHSATLALEAWCTDHNIAGEGQITATPAPDAHKELTTEQRERLEISEDEPVKYRQVKLSCGDKVLSEADNWYIPGRLTDEMNTQLETTNTPFGRVVQDLQISRNTHSATVLWEVLPTNWDIMTISSLQQWTERQPALTYDADRSIFRHEAIVSRGTDGLPISEVHETYKMTLLESLKGE